MEEVNIIAEEIRQEPFQMFRNNCFRKSLKFKRMCQEIGVRAKVVFAITLTPCNNILLPPYVIWFHAWAEIDSQRIELARSLNERNMGNAFDIDIRPIISIQYENYVPDVSPNSAKREGVLSR